MYLEALDDAIAMHLRKSGKTQEDFARELGMSVNTFRWKRNGEDGKEFKTSELVRICETIGCDIADIMAEQRDKYGWPEIDPEEGPVDGQEEVV